MYLALYRKYRPRTFDDVISQEHITTTLKNQLKNGQHSHAYLFTGSRGTGKTTCAKILAKALNCLDPKDGNPCLECENCKEGDSDFSDVSEIDAASNNGVDFIRELREEAFYSPVSGKYRVYIIDEIHMLTMSSFNALLKIIEEPPAHVVFIFATTELNKIPATILSRCQKFEFRRIDIEESKKRLLYVAEKEGKTLSPDAAFLISRLSQGGMRDALSLLDQCFSVTDNVSIDTVKECAGVSGTEHLFRISDLIYEGKSAQLLKLFDELINRSKDPVSLCDELVRHYRNIMLMKGGADNGVLRLLDDETALYKEQSEKYPMQHVFRCLTELNEALLSMGRVKNNGLALEMCFISLCDPKLENDTRALGVRVEKLERSLASALDKLSSGEFAVRSAPAEDHKDYTHKDIDEKADISNDDISVLRSVPAQADENDRITVGSADEDKAPAKDAAENDFMEWSEIVGSLPFSIKILIEGTTATEKDGIVYIHGSSLSVKYATGEFRAEIQKYMNEMYGKKYTIASEDNTENTDAVQQQNNKTNKVTDFLEFAGSKGVKIKKI